MADSGREIKNLEKLQQEEQRLLALQKERVKEKKKLHHMQEKQLKRLQDEIKLKKKDLEETKKANKEYDSFLKSYNKLSSAVQNQLKGSNEKAGTFLSLGRQIANQKAVEARYSEDTSKQGKKQYEAAQSRLSILGDISSDLLAQAKATQDAEDKLKGVSGLEKELRDFRASATELDEEQIKLGEEAIIQKELLKQKQEQLNQLQESQKDLYDALPDSIKGMVSGAQKFGSALVTGALPLVLISSLAIATLSSFTKLDSAAEDFRKETGITNSQMGEMKSQANDIVKEFAGLGVEATDVFNTIKALKTQFSDIVQPSQEVVSALTVMTKNFGVSAENGAKVQGIFEQIGGLSAETAASTQLQVANMANLAGVAPAKIMEDIAENAEIASTLFQGDVESLAQAAIEARRLGTNLKSVATTTEHLLDFQGNIGDELTAATFVGGQFNLTQARSLAAAGKTVEAQKEVLKQLQRSGDFRKKDYFTQQQLAKAAGMSVEEINKQLNAQEKLNSLSSEQRALADKAIEQGLDITDISKEDLANQVASFAKQKEIQGNLTDIKNSFEGIISSVGSVFVPILNGIATVINYIKDSIAGLVGFFGTLAALSTIIYYNKMKTYVLAKKEAILEAWRTRKSIIGAVASIFQGQGKLPIIGAIIAAAMVGGLFAAIAKGSSKANDFSQGGYGKRMMFSPEGTISFNDSDTILAGTNLGGGGGGMTAAQAERLIAAAEKQRETYLDGRRVTANVERAVDMSTKNNASIGT